MKLLLLAGTAEARALAGELAQVASLSATAALAGVTDRPEPYPIPVRRGGFGGADGLAAYLSASGTDLLVDATHPFAAQMSANAVAAAARAGIPLIRLERPPWIPNPGETWVPVPDAQTAACALPAGATAFLAIGPGSLAPFLQRRDLRLVLRAIAAPTPLPEHPALSVIEARPPFELEAELDALRACAATHLVAKNAGGDAGRTKLDAARQLSLPVVMIARPRLCPAETVVHSVSQARARIRAIMPHA